MSCNNIITAGISANCENNMGGVLEIYITDRDGVTAITESGGTVSDITLSASYSFHQFKFSENTSSFEENSTINLENGTSYFSQIVSLAIARRDVDKRNKIGLLAAGQKKLAVIVKDNNGNYWLIGRTNGARLTEITGGSGANRDELNGYNITITANEAEQAPLVDSTIISGIVTES